LISTDECGAAYHFIENNKNGYIVKAGSVDELSKAMQVYIDKPDMISEHSQYTLKIYQQYTPQANVERFCKAIDYWIQE
jgi:glycosyltransferase involved in cell wall biosynthesis